MKKRKSKVLSLLLATAMIISLFPMIVSADETDNAGQTAEQTVTAPATDDQTDETPADTDQTKEEPVVTEQTPAPQADEDVPAAEPVAKIGNKTYSTLKEALEAAEKETGAVTIELLDNVTWETGGSHTSTPLIGEKSKAVVTIDGKGKTLTATGAGIGPIRAANGTILTLQNMTVVDQSVSYAEGNWELGYLEFAGKINCKKVTFKDSIMLLGDSASFSGCEFNGIESQYAAWVRNGKATFNGCTFKGTRGLKMHEAYNDNITGELNDVKDVVVDQCVFTTTDKPGVVIGKITNNRVVIKDSKFNGVPGGDQGQYSFESDTDLGDFTLERSGNTFTDVDLEKGKDLVEGTYDKNVTEIVAEGYVAKDNGNGTWTVMTIEEAAKGEAVDNNNTQNPPQVDADNDVNTPDQEEGQTDSETQTGDNSNLALMLMLMGLSVAGMITLGVHRKRSRQ